MTFRDQLLRMGAEAIDGFHAVMPEGINAEISIVISHKGTVADAIVLGDHDMNHLLSVLLHVDQGTCEVLDVSASKVNSLGIRPDRPVQ